MQEEIQDIIKRKKIEHSFNFLKDIYREEDTNLSLFSRKTWIIFFVISACLFVVGLYLFSIPLLVLCFISAVFSMHRISKIINWMNGAREGIISGFEYGETYGYLESLTMDINYLPLRIWSRLYEYGFNEDNEDDVMFSKYLQHEIDKNKLTSETFESENE